MFTCTMVIAFAAGSAFAQNSRVAVSGTVQRAHVDVDDPPFRIDSVETIRLLHGRLGGDGTSLRASPLGQKA